jgi:Protein kinase domain
VPGVFRGVAAGWVIGCWFRGVGGLPEASGIRPAPAEGVSGGGVAHRLGGKSWLHCLWSDPDHVYLADFGITKHTVSRSGLTPTGQLVGTIDYVAPEQIQGEPVDGRADIYSLGCVLYECLTGSVPFPKDLDAAVILAHIEELPVAPSTLRPELPPALDEVLDRVLAKEPGHRFQTCRELLGAAQAALPDLASHPHTVLARRAEPLAFGATTHPGGSGRRSGSRPAGAGTGPTQTGQRPAQRGQGPDGGRPGGGTGQAGGGPPGGSPRPRRRTGSWPRWLAAAAGLALVLGAGIGGWVATHSGNSVQPVRAAAGSASAAAPSHSPSAPAMMHSPLMQALAVANQSVTAKGLLPPSSCHPHSTTMVTCTRPALGIAAVSFRTYPSLSSLYRAYVTDVRHLSNGQFRPNFGDCTKDQVSGEVSWNHNYQHPRNYSVSQLASGHIKDDKAAGRVFCTFMNDQLYLVWTQNDGHLLAMLNGAPHENAWVWWRGIHHSISLSGTAMHM